MLCVLCWWLRRVAPVLVSVETRFNPLGWEVSRECGVPVHSYLFLLGFSIRLRGRLLGSGRLLGESESGNSPDVIFAGEAVGYIHRAVQDELSLFHFHFSLHHFLKMGSNFAVFSHEKVCL